MFTSTGPSPMRSLCTPAHALIAVSVRVSSAGGKNGTAATRHVCGVAGVGQMVNGCHWISFAGHGRNQSTVPSGIGGIWSDDMPTYPNPDWDNQFAETEDETFERWKRIKARRKAEGKCWQCAKLVNDCDCPNIQHAKMERTDEV